jgi:hypothetical protein
MWKCVQPPDTTLLVSRNSSRKMAPIAAPSSMSYISTAVCWNLTHSRYKWLEKYGIWLSGRCSIERHTEVKGVKLRVNTLYSAQMSKAGVHGTCPLGQNSLSSGHHQKIWLLVSPAYVLLFISHLTALISLQL